MTEPVLAQFLNEPGVFVFACPGCGCAHYVDERWTFNGDLVKPTIRASILVRGHENGEDYRCHSFVTDGKIKFLNDCTHKLAGQTVPLEPWG